jgi:hypothetical protein
MPCSSSFTDFPPPFLPSLHLHVNCCVIHIESLYELTNCYGPLRQSYLHICVQYLQVGYIVEFSFLFMSILSFISFETEYRR